VNVELGRVLLGFDKTLERKFFARHLVPWGLEFSENRFQVPAGKKFITNYRMNKKEGSMPFGTKKSN